MRHERPDPDALLQRVQGEERRATRGRLKLFLGMSAGVGKTYAMLSEAHEELGRGVDVLIGLAETHGRKETEALLRGLPTIPLRTVHYRDVVLSEFNLDEALRRRPQRIVVDELPHTNAPGSRHPKRWQDVEELLAAGIDVSTAINVQHIESLRDVVAGITGVFVQETVPDAFIDAADEVEVVDIPPDELRQRLGEGKVYVSTQVDRALDGFFKKGNLLALRELALRRTADRIDAERRSLLDAEGTSPGLWSARDRVLVCIAPNRLGERVVRTAARLGTATHAHMVALYVESARQRHRSEEDRDRAQTALRLAESLGMEVATRRGHDIVGEILRYAEKKGVNLIVVGKPIKARWREVLHGSVVDELVRRSGDIDVHVITAPRETVRGTMRWSHPDRPATSVSYTTAVATVAVTTLLCLLFHGRMHLANVVMLYLLGVAFVSSRFGLRESLLSTVLSVAAFDFFFVDPRLTFAVGDVRFLPTFAVMFLVALLISRLAGRLREEAEAAATRERRTAALYEMSRDLAASHGRKELATAAARRIRDEFEIDAGVLLPNERGRLTVAAKSRSHFETTSSESAVAQWAYEHAQAAGASTNTLPGSAGLYLPLIAGKDTVGVMALKPILAEGRLEPGLRSLMETFANGLALAIERTQLARESQRARLDAETQRMRNALLSSVSHDLRTPLTAIWGAAARLLDTASPESPEERALLETIVDESERLNGHVQNLLDMTRLESGPLALNLEWHSFEELVASALARTARPLGERPVTVEIPESLPLVRVDGRLIETALVNLLENAARHTPPRTPIWIRAEATGDRFRFEVADAGLGLPPGSPERLFERFQRGRGAPEDGVGLGLAIVKAVADAHGGTVRAANRPEGGASFTMEISQPDAPPEVPRG